MEPHIADEKLAAGTQPVVCIFRPPMCTGGDNIRWRLMPVQAFNPSPGPAWQIVHRTPQQQRGRGRPALSQFKIKVIGIPHGVTKISGANMMAYKIQGLGIANEGRPVSFSDDMTAAQFEARVFHLYPVLSSTGYEVCYATGTLDIVGTECSTPGAFRAVIKACKSKSAMYLRATQVHQAVGGMLSDTTANSNMHARVHQMLVDRLENGSCEVSNTRTANTATRAESYTTDSHQTVTLDMMAPVRESNIKTEVIDDEPWGRPSTSSCRGERAREEERQPPTACSIKAEIMDDEFAVAAPGSCRSSPGSDSGSSSQVRPLAYEQIVKTEVIGDENVVYPSVSSPSLPDSEDTSTMDTSGHSGQLRAEGVQDETVSASAKSPGSLCDDQVVISEAEKPDVGPQHKHEPPDTFDTTEEFINDPDSGEDDLFSDSDYDSNVPDEEGDCPMGDRLQNGDGGTLNDNISNTISKGDASGEEDGRWRGGDSVTTHMSRKRQKPVIDSSFVNVDGENGSCTEPESNAVDMDYEATRHISDDIQRPGSPLDSEYEPSAKIRSVKRSRPFSSSDFSRWPIYAGHTHPQPPTFQINHWRKAGPQPPNQNIKFQGNPGIKCDTTGFKPVDFLQLYFDDELIQHIVTQTNLYADQFIAANNLPQHSRVNLWVPVDCGEMKKFLAANLLMGVHKLPTIQHYWSTKPLYSLPIFRSVMTLNRFLLILKFLHFSDSFLQPSPGDPDYDRLYKIRPVINHLQRKFQVVYEPHCNICIGERPLLLQGDLDEQRQEQQTKQKCGIKISLCCESDGNGKDSGGGGYCFQFNVHTGSKIPVSEILPDVPDFLTSSEKTVLSLIAPLVGRGYHVYSDKQFTSLNLFLYLLEKQTLACGMVPATSIPDKLRSWQVAPGSSAAVCGDQKIVATKHHGDKTCHFLSTIHGHARQDYACTRGIICCPKVSSDHAKHRGGVDRLEQFIQPLSCVRRSTKWTKTVFFHLLQMAVCNAFILACKRENREHCQYLSFLESVISSWLSLEGKRVQENAVWQNQLPESPSASVDHTLLKASKLDDDVRLTEKHFCYPIPARPTNKLPRRRCRVCRKKGVKKKEIRHYCPSCPSKPSLCYPQCFVDYHTKFVYWM